MKYALVTGGSRGIGRAICLQLARDGYSVIINYKSNHDAANETLRMIEKEGGRAELLPFDVASPDAINTALSQWEQAHKDDYVEVLVNNAGITRDNLFLDMDHEDWHSVIDTALNGFYYVTRSVLPEMVIHHNGRIINMSSMAGVYGNKGQVNYAVAKAALVGATKSLAQEVAAKGITVNAIAPGVINTKINSDKTIAMAESHTPIHRAGKTGEVADLVSFLVSNKASYITGQVIGIDGGGWCV